LNYYQKHIGDFNNATRHLSRIERSIFSDAIELYYDTEKPLVSDIAKLARLLLVTTTEEKTALKLILDEFFVLKKVGYFNKRCCEEIEKYQGYIDQKSRAGKASAKLRSIARSSTVEQSLNVRATNHNPLPLPSPSPIKTKTVEKTFQPLARLLSLKVEQQVARDWLLIRKAKKKPLTETALNKIINQAKKGGYTLQAALTISCEEGWAGFDPSWKHSLNGGGEEKVVKVAWYASEDATQSKGIEIGCLRKDSESLGDYRERIQQQLSGVNYVR
jgi:uncharacterized protein YdaU (DUF1376 family)